MMEQSEITAQLQNIKDEDRAQYELEDIVRQWKEKAAGYEAIDPILSFMESHSSWDLGMPGALTHFLESFYKKGLEEKLISSIERRPSAHTIIILLRIIKAEKDMDKKKYYLNCLESARTNPNTDEAALMTLDVLKPAGN